jgi:hypothetical protein
MNPFFIDNTFTHLYCTDAIRSAKWYYDHFGCRLITLNGNGFATLQLAPGRIMFLTKDKESARNVGFVATNIVALRNHLRKLNAEIEDNDDPESTWFMMTDPDGNRIEIWNGDRFGVNTVNYSTPSWVEHGIWCSFEERDGFHGLAIPVDMALDRKQLTDRLLAACSEMRLVPKSPEIVTLVDPDPNGTLYACIEFLNSPPTVSNAAGIKAIYVPPHKYAVFYITGEERFRESYKDKYAWLSDLEINKPDRPAYILEYEQDDEIKAYLPVSY